METLSSSGLKPLSYIQILGFVQTWGTRVASNFMLYHHVPSWNYHHDPVKPPRICPICPGHRVRGAPRFHSNGCHGGIDGF